MRNLFRLLFLVFCFTTTSGQINMDSLKLASHSTVDSVRFKAYSFLSWNSREKDKKEALKYSGLLLNEATAVDNKKWISRALSDFSVIYEMSGDRIKALEYAKKALESAKQAGVKKDLAGTLLNLSALLSGNNKIAEALEMQLQALKLYEELDKKYYIAVTCNAIGMSYSSINNYEKSIGYLKRAFEISKQRNDLYLQAITLGGMADNYKSLNKPDSSKLYYSEAKNAFKQIGDLSNFATACNNLGELYFKLGKIKESESEYREALATAREMEDEGGISIYQANLAKVFTKEGNYTEAEDLLLKSLSSAQKLGNGEAELIIYDNLINLYTRKKDGDKAEFYFNKYNAMRDTIFSKEMAQGFSEAQTKFDVEKKDLEIMKNKAELESEKQAQIKKNLVIILIIVIFFATLLSIFFINRKKQVQQKAMHDAELASQKEIRAKLIIEAEEKERRRIAQDLHDGIGQILSAAKLNLSSLESTIETNTQSQKDALKNTLNLIDDSVREVRTVSHNMMPNTLIKLGLASAVREFITKLGGLPNLKIDLEIVGLDQRLEENTETALYRAIQEIVNNIIKHAQANKIGIQLIRHEKELSVMIEDNGIGFDVQKINEFDGIGLKNILSRIEFINGTVHFDSTKGRGTSVVIEVNV